MPYRKDIDGLRAIAVLGVIFYHSEILIGNKFFLSGGFLGVDIFFVISGYLITSIIYQENKTKKTFSFLNFYERRIRRLLPALLVVLSFSLFLTYFFLLPVQFKAYINSVISSIFFYSNFYFHYSGQAYGETILSSKPLLHTWSLAVEEQFYILYPIFFVFCINFFKFKIKYLFYFIIIISVLFASIISENHASFNFYMIVTRAWELMIGGLVALKHFNEKKIIKENKYLPFIGLLLILFSFYFFDDPHKHPTYLTLIPIIGCCLIINNKKDDNFLSKILSNKIMVSIGLISYSLYLWHHPILSLGKISGITENNSFIKILLIIISFILSILTYHYVEKKFRNKKIISNRNLKLILLPIICCLIFLSVFLPQKQKKLYPEILVDLYDQTWFTTKQFNKPCFQRKTFFCRFGDDPKNETVFLIGDSVMASIQEELKNNLINRNINFIPMTNAGCDFFDKTKNNKEDSFCNPKIQKKRNIKIQEYKKSTIILHLNYKNISKNNDEDLSNFIYNINKYLNLNYKIILMYPIPQWSTNVSKLIEKQFNENKTLFFDRLKNNKNFIYLDYDEYIINTKKIFDKFDELNHKNLFKIYPHQKFCNKEIPNRCLAHSSNHIFVVDGSHLSKKGSMYINTDLIKLLDKIYLD
tara:strand:+ start:1157 stop:3085 length:1929 start_codon:yes stop_codon:yes gene_type:complete